METTTWTPGDRQVMKAEIFSETLRWRFLAARRRGEPYPERHEARRQRAILRVLRFAALRGHRLGFHVYPKGAMEG